MHLRKVIICLFAITGILISDAVHAECKGGCKPVSQFGLSCSCDQNFASPAPSATVPPASVGNQLSDYEAEIVRQVNEERAKYGLAPLSVSDELSQAAYIRAVETTTIFSHTRPDGTKWSTVSPYAKGENIARGHRSVDKVMAAWLTSDGHRTNILRESFRTIGVCAYDYNGIMYWVQLFGP